MQDGKLKFSAAVRPDSLQSLHTDTDDASGENFLNFYTKTKDIDVDEGLINQLKEAQKAIDEGEDEGEYYEEEDNHDTRSLKDDYLDEDDIFSSLSDFGGSKSASRLDEGDRFDCFSCDPPDCSYGSVSEGCIQCYTAHIRHVHGGLAKSKGCVPSAESYPFMCLTEQHDGRHIHAKHGASAQYAVDCCDGTMCNNATAWPVLPEVPRDVEKG